MKSVQRYSKQHALTMHLARLPAGVKQRGRALMGIFQRFVRHLPSALKCVFKAGLKPLLLRDVADSGRRLPPVVRAVGRSHGGVEDAMRTHGASF